MNCAHCHEPTDLAWRYCAWCGHELARLMPTCGMTPDAVVMIWNRVTAGVLPSVQSLTPGRRKHIKARMAKERDAAWWEAYFKRIVATPFCKGSNGRGWRANIDFATRSEDVVARVMEGTYDGAVGNSRRTDVHGVDELKDMPEFAYAFEQEETR